MAWMRYDLAESKNGNQVTALLVQIASKPCVTATGEAGEKQQQTKQSPAQEARLTDVQYSFSRPRHTL